MKISLITICYNSEQTIRATLESVRLQNFSRLEYIIIDGASEDGTLSIIDEYKDIVSVIISEPDQGIYDAMNKGISLATGDVIGILNSDDVFADAQVLKDVANIFTDAEIDALYADLQYVKRDDITKVTRYWRSGKYKYGAFRRGWMPPHPTFYVRSTMYNRFGGFDLRLRTSADYELMLRFIHVNKINLHYLKRVIVKMRVGGQSNESLKNRMRGNNEDKLAWKYNGLTPPIGLTIIKPLRKLGQFLRW